MKQILNHLFQHKTLSREEARLILIDISEGKYNHYQISAFLTAFIMRNITLEELKGFRDGLIELRLPVDLSEYNPMDLCGTGGDGKNTFNVSTLSSFLVAGAGIPVAKHGNYGVSSISGSSNVLSQCGISFKTKEDDLKIQLEEANICFLHAPLFHPAMGEVAPIRKKLKVKTFFNMLGPLVNPCQPKVQLIGVFNLELARMYQYLFQELDNQYTIVHALDGYDEIVLTGDAKLLSNNGEKIVNSAFFGLDKVKKEQLVGGNTVEEAAAIFTDIIQGNGTKEQNNVVIANSATAIKTYYPEMAWEESIERAKESLYNKKALKSFNALKSIK